MNLGVHPVAKGRRQGAPDASWEIGRDQRMNRLGCGGTGYSVPTREVEVKVIAERLDYSASAKLAERHRSQPQPQQGERCWFGRARNHGAISNLEVIAPQDGAVQIV